MSLAVFALIATPALAFLGVLMGHRTTRRGAVEPDRWRKREETMRLLRWATELAMDPEPARSPVGVEVLGAPIDAPMLDVEDRALGGAVLSAAAGDAMVEEAKGQPP